MKSFVVGMDLTIRVFVSAGANSVLFIPCKGLDLVQISADWVVLLTEMTQAKSETCEETGGQRAKQGGVPRKPLAEVILASAPLRATSSALEDSTASGAQRQVF